MVATPIIKNGKYTIYNVAQPKLILDLFGGEPQGLIVAYSPPDQQWNVVNINPDSADQIILGSAGTANTYATAYNEFRGSGIGGTGNATVWTVVAVGSNYYLKDRNGLFLQVAGSGGSILPIVLDKTSGESAQWTFK